ncbi:MAG: pantetheine-phosphate adenylyltransferase [Promicromonosporaceae bacterium]|nr:pantetheine-phosphate adenylyltransferase [Promicromonosporaceae bacterium]
MTIAIYPGSFDPPTLGHLDVIRRARGLFDELRVIVAHNPAKAGLLPPETRIELLAEAVPSGVRVEAVDGLLADYCRDHRVSVIVKGVRSAADFAADLPEALMNRHLSGVETAFVLGDPALSHISSSLVKVIAAAGGPVADLVPAAVAARLKEKM